MTLPVAVLKLPGCLVPCVVWVAGQRPPAQTSFPRLVCRPQALLGALEHLVFGVLVPPLDLWRGQ